MHSSAEHAHSDEVDAALDDAVTLVERAVVALPAGVLPIVLIDGRSGAGKSTVAARVRARWAGPVTMIGLDELYPGWDGLAEGAEIARTRILEPLASGRSAHWNRWDWVRDAPGDGVVTPAFVPLILEGSGVLTPASAALAPVRLWLESAEPGRRDRALARDGDTYRPHWQRWARQEEAHLCAHHPRDLATIRVDVP